MQTALISDLYPSINLFPSKRKTHYKI
uniref:Uncharacterized protein n=1 Tax=Rhizophora mucronata TaxID=61149 RepID=A0A2P2M255_RHIMU